MNSAILESPALQPPASSVVAPVEKRGLVAQWHMEAGKLVCRWVSA